MPITKVSYPYSNYTLAVPSITTDPCNTSSGFTGLSKFIGPASFLNTASFVSLNSSTITNTGNITSAGGIFTDVVISNLTLMGGLAGNAQLTVRSTLASRSGIVVRGATAASVDIQQWQDSAGSSVAAITSSGNLALNAPSPTISSTNPTAASIFTSTVTGVTIGSSTIKTVEYPADGTTSSGAAASGYMGMPRGNSGNAITGAYAVTAADAGKHLYVTTTGQTITLPANGTTPLPIGTTIVVINGNGVSTTIAITTDTLRQANTANTGSRTLASNGMATIVKVNTTEWIIGGNGLS